MTHPGVFAMVVVGFAFGAFLYYMFNEKPEEHKNSNHQYNYNHEYGSPSGSRNSRTTDEDEGSRRRKRRMVSNTTNTFCTICLEEVDRNDHVELEKCHHMFHRTCMLMWNRNGMKDTHDKCPICREEYKSL